MAALQSVNMDAWSDGQMRSKLWLCRELERFWSSEKSARNIWLYGSWYGLLAQFLLLRERLQIHRFDLFDVDLQALEISEKMLDMWRIQRKVECEFHSVDCNEISTQWIEEQRPDLVINTSCEHFSSDQWFHRLPPGQMFLLQSTNMQHPTHVRRPESLQEFVDQLGCVSEIYLQEQLAFRYPQFEFDRYMVIGRK